MRKLKLALDDLTVDTFAVNEPTESVGTVRGNAEGAEAALFTRTWMVCGTCKGNTCEGSCLSCGPGEETNCNITYCQTKTELEPVQPVYPVQPANPLDPFGLA